MRLHAAGPPCLLRSAAHLLRSAAHPLRRAWLPLRRAALLLLVLASLPTVTQAQFLPFGRNKISYEPFDWHVLRTGHFDIYYYPAMETLARQGAVFAEESFTKLERVFNFTIRHRIPLIFYSSPIHFQQTNVTPGFIPDGVGGFFEFLKGRVVIPSNGSLEQFRHVINHELVHVFMHNKVETTLADHAQPNEKYPPLWFVEGLAEYYSTEWDSQAEMLVRDAVLTGYFQPLATIMYIEGSFLMYKEGQAALMFIAEEFGEERIIELLDNVRVSQNFSDVIRYTLGVSVEEFDRRWMRHLRAKYWPLAATHARPTDASLPLVVEGFNAKPVLWTHGDSTHVIHLANRDGYTSIYASSLRGGESRLLVRGEKTDEFEAFHLFQGRMAVSAQGLLAFAAKSGERDVLHLYDLVRERLVRTLVFDDLVMIGTVSWNPDGTRLAMAALDEGGRNDLYIVTPEGMQLDRLTADDYDDRDPAWSPDGTTIVFTSDRGSAGVRGRQGLYAFDVALRRITTVAVGDENYASPAWSTDGKLLAFTCDRDGTHDLYVIDRARLDEDAMRRVTRFTTAAFDPVWTPKGSLVFGTFDAYSFQIRGIREVAARVDSLDRVPRARFDRGAQTWTARQWTGSASTDAATLRYERDYELDIAQSQISTDPVFGTLGGAAVSLSDVLGDDRYYFMLYNTAQTSSEFLSSFNIAISRVSVGQRTPYAYGIFNYAGRRYDFLDPDRYFTERAYGGYFALAYPLSKFRRIEGSVSVSNSDKVALTDVRQRTAMLVTNSISYVKDNALYYYTGPIDGNRFNLTLSYTTDVQYSNVNYYSVMADYRRYFRIGMRSAVAMRAEVLYNHGKEARRYFLGGSWDLRGWPRWSIRGTKRWLTSVELRFPLLDRVGLDLPFGSMTLGLLRGAVFIDAGNSWDVRYGETLGSIGGGLRFSLFGIFVLRYDIGKRIENNFTRLQSDTYHQFFFGWDF